MTNQMTYNSSGITLAELTEDITKLIGQAQLNLNMMNINYTELQKPGSDGEGIVTAAAMVVMAQSRYNTLVQVWEMITGQQLVTSE